MRLYARERELAVLENQYLQVKDKSIMTVITGRRRIGKTLLSKLCSIKTITLHLVFFLFIMFF